MILRINKSIKLSTGQSASATIVELFAIDPDLVKGTIYAEVKAWNSLANQTAGHDHSYLWDVDKEKLKSAKKRTNLTFVIPKVDSDKDKANGNWAVAGEKYPVYMRQALADITGCALSDVEIIGE